MMKKLTFALVSVLALIAFASCDKENDLVSAAKISVDPTTLTFEESGGGKDCFPDRNQGLDRFSQRNRSDSNS